MRETRITFPELGLVAGTRVLGGIGLGLLLADRLTSEQRKAAGWALLLAGAVTTVPLVLEILGHSRTSSAELGLEGPARELSERRGQRETAVPQI